MFDVSSRLRLWAVTHGVLLVLGLAVLVAAPVESSGLPALGQNSPLTVTSTARTTFVDRAATAKLRATARAAVPPIYRSNRDNAATQAADAGVLFRNIRSVLRKPSVSESEKRIEIRQRLGESQVKQRGLPNLPSRQWRAASYWTTRLLQASLGAGGFDASRQPAVGQALLETLPKKMELATQEVVSAIFMAYLTPTQVLDVGATVRERSAAAERVQPVEITVLPGTIVVRRGQVVTPSILEELKAVGMPTGNVDWQARLGSDLFAAVVIFVMLWYLLAFHQELVGDVKLMFLLDGLILVMVLAAKIVIPGHTLLPYFFPLAAAPALAGLLASSEVGVALAMVLALLIGWVVGGSFQLATYFLLTGATAALGVRRLRRLHDFILSGAYIAVAAAALIAAFHLLDGGYDSTAIRNYIVAAAGYGVISAALAFGGFVVLGNAFGATTTLHLLELAHPDRPLLRKLMAEAPGTYNHSLIVSSMVERAAREIGADVLLGRVMAMYHDVGKITNPLCFIENQFGTTNIHDSLRPDESADIIRGHVSHGVTMARQQRLPMTIQNGILEHHGTMLIAYFFHRALKEDASADAGRFSYAGPKPRSRESGLLMLADGCEGSVRAEQSKTPESIRDTVNRIIDERVADGQLSECALTLRDLDIARTAFSHVLNGIYHPRIEYPANPLARATP